MKVIERTTMTDGTKIQLEDWFEHNTEQYPDLYGLMIGAYPIAKNTGKYGLIRSDEAFRISISQNKHTGYSDDNVLDDFKALKNGRKFLEDLSEHFWDGEKDMWHLGMDVEYKGW